MRSERKGSEEGDKDPGRQEAEEGARNFIWIPCGVICPRPCPGLRLGKGPLPLPSCALTLPSDCKNSSQVPYTENF